MKKILFVEDDVEYSNFITEQLLKVPYEVDCVYSGIDAMEHLALNQYDLLLTDLELDVLDGLRLVDSARKMAPGTRSIILTGKPSNHTELESLKLHADLYIEKSKSLKVILHYIANILERESLPITHIKFLSSSVENIMMDLRNRTVYKENVSYKLTPTEFNLLEYFLNHKNTLVMREDLLRAVWAEEPTADNIRKVDVHLKNLRTKMGIFSIVSVRGAGYKWNEGS
ncbi:response regulator [Erysipelothrix rhusiopathiae]|uniref:DNA-binding response regulator n=1 Tax=Erysipelothrix piscisicarius TaxID=2485784 RepID=A0A3S5HJV6_9FIRM|nr:MULTISPECIES: response regulator transcription factor [Erysipelothrix]AZK43429.1 DNA-binding response regulator [Erysipelothrix piscisicarius]MBK2404676.1 response regulator [Erysipelothrix sp. strain 2 (EsS2-7-Brazil)]NBA01796.1 response regulator [Erysipelothrix rhusiopathiae]